MKYRKKSSSTAKLVALTYYFYLLSRKESEKNAYEEFYLKHCFNSLKIARVLKAMRQMKLAFIFRIVERLMLPDFIKHIGTRKTLIYSLISEEIQNGIQQVAVLGAGLDPLPIWLAQQYSNLVIFEVDHPLTQNEKRKSYPAIPQNLKITACDFSKDSLIEKLIVQDFNSSSSTLFLWEGVSMYLPQRQVENFFKTAALASSCAKILFTFLHQRPDRKISFRKSSPVVSWILKFYKEPFLWGYPRSQVATFLKPLGWSLVHLYSESNTHGLIPESEGLAVAQNF